MAEALGPKHFSADVESSFRKQIYLVFFVPPPFLFAKLFHLTAYIYGFFSSFYSLFFYAIFFFTTSFSAHWLRWSLSKRTRNHIILFFCFATSTNAHNENAALLFCLCVCVCFFHFFHLFFRSSSHVVFIRIRNVRIYVATIVRSTLHNDTIKCENWKKDEESKRRRGIERER